MSRATRLLNTDVEIWRYSRVPDGGGGWEETWALLATVRARLSQPSAAERQVADQAQGWLTHVAYLESGADVRRGDEIRQAGLTLEVIATFEPSVPGTYRRANCTAQQPDLRAQ